jgi:DNA-binding LacI/PurR family transcriptional regulator
MLCETSQVMPARQERLPHQKISLKFLADHLQLSPATISLVMNRSKVADSIPQETKDRIFAAAREFNYRPSFVARSLRTQRSFTVSVMMPEVSEGYGTLLLRRYRRLSASGGILLLCKCVRRMRWCSWRFHTSRRDRLNLLT